MAAPAPTTSALLQSVDLGMGILKPDPFLQLTSLLSLDPKATDLTAFDSVTKANGETFLFRASLYEEYKKAEWKMVVTNKCFYKCDPSLPLSNPRKRKPLIDFHSVEADSSNPLSFTTRLYKDSIKSSVKQSLLRFIGNLGSKIDTASMLQVRSYTCKSEIQRDQIVWVLSRAIRDEWQTMLEDQLIPEPQYYQAHQFVIKVNRKGAQQERLLVLSNEQIYNLEVTHSPTTIADVKWGIHLQALQSISIESGSSIVLFFDHDKAARLAAERRDTSGHSFNLKDTDNYIFAFPDDRSRASFVAVLAHLHTRANRSATSTLGVGGDAAAVSPVLGPQSATAKYDFTAADLAPEPEGTPETGTKHAPALAGGMRARPRASTIGNAGAAPPEANAAAAAAQQDSPVPAAPVVPAGHAIDKHLLLEELEKLVKGSSKSHVRTFALYPDLTIKWGDNERKFKYQARVIAVAQSAEVVDKLNPEKRPKFFALKTTEKPLYLVAPTVHARATWISLIDSLLARGNALAGASTSAGSPNTLGGFATSARALDSALPVIRGPMVKYIKGGRDKHVKFFCVYSNLTIKWGENEGNLKHSAVVTDIDQDLAEFDGKIARSDAIRFVRIKTTDKTLELLCPNQDSADHWVITIGKLLNPEEDDVGGGYGFADHED